MQADQGCPWRNVLLPLKRADESAEEASLRINAEWVVEQTNSHLLHIERLLEKHGEDLDHLSTKGDEYSKTVSARAAERRARRARGCAPHTRAQACHDVCGGLCA